MGVSISSVFTQLFPPKPQFTEKDVPDLHGKVYLITGANTGLGKELARMLYSKNAKIYIAARSEEKSNKAIEEIKKAAPTSTGSLTFLHLDLNDLSTIKTSTQRFLATETKLHVLFNNAGVQNLAPIDKSRTAQGYEAHIGVNNLGAFLFTKLLTPLLISTAASSPPNTVRVVWVSSNLDLAGAKHTAIELDNLDYHVDKPAMIRYGLSKGGNWLQAVEMAKRYKAEGVISVALNPGNLRTELYREQGVAFRVATRMIMYPVVDGACTELFAGVSGEITLEGTGCWVVPFGRVYPVRKDYEAAMKTKAEGGNGAAKRFWEWNEEQVKPYL